MAQVASYRPGTPSWVDLATTDTAVARAFYGELFGWDSVAGPPETGGYTNFCLRGARVAGLHELPPDLAEQGQLPSWTTYIATDDADTTAARIRDAGGTLLYGPVDVLDEGRMISAIDASGGPFGVWQAGRHAGSGLVGEPGAMAWNELHTRNLAVAGHFYARVFDWTLEPLETAGPAYRTARLGDRTVCGLLEMGAEFPPEIPSYWMTYFAVADVESTIERIRRLGGNVVRELADSSFGRWAVVQDPTGAVLSVIQLPGRPGASAP